MPDTVALANTLVELNDTLNNAPSFSDLLADIESLETSVNNLPELEPIRESLSRLNTTMNEFQNTQAMIVEVLVKINSSIGSFPNFSPIREEVKKIDNVYDAVPCIDSLAKRMRHINQTVLLLPEGISDVITMMEDVNSTLDTLPDFDDVLENLDKMNGTLDSMPDMEEYIDIVNDMKEDIEDMPNIDDLVNDIDSLDGDRDIDLNNTKTETRDLEESMRDPSSRPSPEMVQNLHDFNESRNDLPPLIDDFVEAVEFWGGNGVLHFDTTVLTSEVDELRNNLNNRPPSEDLTGNLDNIDDSINSIDVGSTISDLDNLKDSLDNIDVSDYVSNMQDLENTIQDLPDIGDLRENWASVNESLNELPDLDEIKDELDDFDQTLADIRDDNSLFDDAESLIDDTIGEVRKAINSGYDTLTEIEDGCLPAFRRKSFRRRLIEHFVGKPISRVLEEEEEEEENEPFCFDFDLEGEYVSALSDNCDTTDCLSQEIKEEDEDVQRQNAVMGLLFLPLLISLLGLCGCIANRGCPIKCMAIIYMFLTPFFFIIFGVAVFPPIVLMTDFCRSVENVAGEIVNGPIASVVNDMIDDALNSTSINITISANGLVDYYFGHCEEKDGIRDISKQIPEVFESFVGDKLDIIDDAMGEITLREKLQSQIDDVKSIINDDIPENLRRLETTMDCTRIRSAYYRFKDSFCCGVVGSISWIFGMMYLLTFTMLCGCCGGLFASRRLRKSLVRLMRFSFSFFLYTKGKKKKKLLVLFY